jgi:hypothetical protein
MTCQTSFPFYVPTQQRGIKVVGSLGDGYTMIAEWHRAYASPSNYRVIYNIYYSSTDGNAIEEGVKFVSDNNSTCKVNLTDFRPGDTYYFVIRASEYDTNWYNIQLLPQISENLYTYPEALLTEDITDTQTIIPVSDASIFPSYGVIQIGYEVIRYSSKDNPNNYLLASERGFLGSEPTIHTTDGYDGYHYTDPIIRFFKGFEEDNLYIIQEQCKFDYDFNIFTETDGYRVTSKVGTLITDLGNHEDERIDFPAYDKVGWHRTDPKLFFQGKCMDSYFGGEAFCADGYLGVNNQIRNMSFSDQADRLQEFLLEELGTGSECVLLRRLWKGITCSCYEPNRESPDPRCHQCLGVGYIGGYEQYFYPRRSDGRILVRFGPDTEDLKLEDAGIENSITYNCWTLSVPTIQDRDVLIRFNPDGTEEFRYEILDMTRNVLLFGQYGNQKFRAQRIRKTSPIYQWRSISSTADIPTRLITTVGLLRGQNGTTRPHTHDVVISNNITNIVQINNTTEITLDHSHPIENGVILPVLGHTHSVII